MRVPLPHFWQDGQRIASVIQDSSPASPPPHSRSGAGDALPDVASLEGPVEPVHVVEVLLAIARLGDQEPDLHQRKYDASEILGPPDAPVLEHRPGQEPVLLQGVLAAGQAQLAPADVAPRRKPPLGILDAGEDEQVGALVVASLALADPREELSGRSKLVHRAAANAGTRPYW